MSAAPNRARPAPSHREVLLVVEELEPAAVQPRRVVRAAEAGDPFERVRRRECDGRLDAPARPRVAGRVGDRLDEIAERRLRPVGEVVRLPGRRGSVEREQRGGRHVVDVDDVQELAPVAHGTRTCRLRARRAAAGRTGCRPARRRNRGGARRSRCRRPRARSARSRSSLRRRRRSARTAPSRRCRGGDARRAPRASSRRTTRLAPAARAASSTRRVPSTLTCRISSAGSHSETTPAQCTTASTPSAARTSEFASPRSPATGSTPPTSSRAGSRTSARTSSPRPASARATAPPMKPVAPVTRTRLNGRPAARCS